MSGINCICINDKHRPANFKNPQKWVKEKKEYTIVNILWIVQSQTLGFQLEEIDLSDNFPYTFFDAKRFAIPADQLEEFEELVKKSKEIHETDEVKEFAEVEQYELDEA